MTDDASTTDTATTATDDKATATTDAGKTFTQEQVNALLAREKGNLQRKFEGFDDLKAKADEFDKLSKANQTDLERLGGERDELKGRAESAETKLLRYEVAADKGVSPKLAKFLSGSTKEEIEEAADELLAEVGGGKTPTGGHDGGPRGSATAAASSGDMNARIRAAAGR